MNELGYLSLKDLHVTGARENANTNNQDHLPECVGCPFLLAVLPPSPIVSSARVENVSISLALCVNNSH